jgi:hypothetical protein
MSGNFEAKRLRRCCKKNGLKFCIEHYCFEAALGRPPAPYALVFSQERPKVPQFWFAEHQEPSNKIKAKRLYRYCKKNICKNIKAFCFWAA